MKKTPLILLSVLVLIGIGFGFKHKIMSWVNPPPPPWPPDLDPVLIYTTTFAQRFGLDPSKATQLAPGILATSMTFNKDYEYKFDPKNGDGSDRLSHKGYGDQLTPDERMEVEDHAAILSVLFPKKYNSKTLVESYKYDTCFLNLYLDNNDPQVKQIDFGPSSVYIEGQVDTTIRYLWFMRHPDTSRGDLDMSRLNAADYRLGDLEYIKQGQSFPDHKSHFANFLPGISFISLKVQCYLAEYPPERTWIWFEKKGGAKYPIYNSSDPKDLIDHSPFNPDDFVKYHIPTQLIQSANAQTAAHATDDKYNY